MALFGVIVVFWAAEIGDFAAAMLLHQMGDDCHNPRRIGDGFNRFVAVRGADIDQGAIVETTEKVAAVFATARTPGQKAVGGTGRDLVMQDAAGAGWANIAADGQQIAAHAWRQIADACPQTASHIG